MIRLTIFAALVISVSAASTAAAQPAGDRGTATAYELDGRTVIDTKTCFRTTRHGGYDYVRCGSRLRDSVKLRVCRAKGPGTHRFMIQLGDSRPYATSVYCRR